MRFNLAILAAACCMTLASCGPSKTAGQQLPSNPIAKPIPKVVSPWHDTTSKDDFTDDLTPSISTDSKSDNGTLTLRCDADFMYATIVSDLFLAASSNGSIKVRFDDEPPENYGAHLFKQVAVLRTARDVQRFLNKHMGDVFADTDAMAFLVRLQGPKSPRRLRVQLTAFDGETKALDFDVTGVRDKLQDLQKRCPKPAR